MVHKSEPDFPSPAYSSQSEQQEFDLENLLRAVWRGKLWVLCFAVLASCVGFYYAFYVAKPIYTSSATVVLQSRQEQVVDLESVVSGLAGDPATINTEVEVMRSRGLQEKVVRELDLVNDPEFNPSLRPSSGPSLRSLLGALRELVSGPAPDPVPPTERERLDSAIDALLSKVSIGNVRQSYVFKINVKTGDPEKSALIANTLARFYVLDQVETKFEATKQATSWLTERVTQLQIELETAESKVKEFNAQTELVSAEALTVLNFQVKELRDRLQEVRIGADAAQVRLDALTTALESGDRATMTEVANDRTLTRLYGFIQDDPAADRAAFDARFDQILDRAALELDRANRQAEALELTIANQQAQIERQSTDLVELQQLQREAEASRLIYEYFLGRLKETSVQQGIQQADSRVLSQAVVPRSPSAPRKMTILVMSFMLGAFFGIAFVVLREISQTTFRSAEDLEARTGGIVMGQIPAIPARSRKNILAYLLSKPNSAAVEAIRNLRTSVLLSNVDNPPQIIVSTSSVPGEGKTTQSLALAQNLGALNKKVLLIEGDIRRRVFAEYFDIPKKDGLVSVITGKTALEDVVTHNDDMGVDILIGEKSSTNAADLFSSERFKSLMETLRDRYDYIIIDTPPVLAVPDARVIGQSVDAVLYTVKWDSTTHRQVAEGLKSFESVNVKVTGLVLGQISSKGMKKYGYGDSYGAYNSYYDS